MLILGAAMWALERYVPVLVIVPSPWNQLGWCVMVVAPLAPIAAIIEFWRARTTMNPFKPEAASTLVTSGIYAWTRNPMYLGLLTVLIGWAIRLGGLTPFAGPLIFIPVMVAVQIRPEEAALRTHFGADFDRYSARVGRWLGRR